LRERDVVPKVSSIAPSSMFHAHVPAVRGPAGQRPSHTTGAVLLTLASLPAVAFGGHPFETMGVLARILARAVSEDLREPRAGS
jgi:hypothetical protein